MNNDTLRALKVDDTFVDGHGRTVTVIATDWMIGGNKRVWLNNGERTFSRDIPPRKPVDVYGN